MPQPKVPSISEKSFSCPRCGAFADQGWYTVYAKEVNSDDKLPVIVDEEYIEKIKSIEENKNITKNMIDRWVKESIETSKGLPSLRKYADRIYVDYSVSNIHISKCRSCSEISIWLHREVLYPKRMIEIEPNIDLDEGIKRDFNEARLIVSDSPRGASALLRLCIQKLCKQLGKKGRNINDDISELVSEGLKVEIQKALDIVRVVGNEAVHPGEMDLNDDRGVAEALFALVNEIAYDRISRPKQIEELFNKLPPSKREGIAKRDSSNKHGED